MSGNTTAASPLTSRPYQQILADNDTLYMVTANPDSQGLQDKRVRITDLESRLFGTGPTLSVDAGTIVHAVNDDVTHTRGNLNLGVLSRFVLGERNDTQTFTVDDAFVIEQAVNPPGGLGIRFETSIGNLKDFILGKTLLTATQIITLSNLSLTLSTTDPNTRDLINLSEFGKFVGENYNNFTAINVGAFNSNGTFTSNFSINSNGALTSNSTGTFTGEVSASSFATLLNKFIVDANGTITSTSQLNNLAGLLIGSPISGLSNVFPISLSQNGSINALALDIFDPTTGNNKFQLTSTGLTFVSGSTTGNLSNADFLNLDNISANLCIATSKIPMNVMKTYDSTQTYLPGDFCQYDPLGGTNYTFYKCINQSLNNTPSSSPTYWLNVTSSVTSVYNYNYYLEDVFELSKPLKLMPGTLNVGDIFTFPRLEARAVPNVGNLCFGSLCYL